MENDNSRKAERLRNLAIMINRLDDERDHLVLCTELNCGGIDCDACIIRDGCWSAARELNEIADILDGKDV